MHRRSYSDLQQYTNRHHLPNQTQSNKIITIIVHDHHIKTVHGNRQSYI